EVQLGRSSLDAFQKAANALWAKAAATNPAKFAKLYGKDALAAARAFNSAASFGRSIGDPLATMSFNASLLTVQLSRLSDGSLGGKVVGPYSVVFGTVDVLQDSSGPYGIADTFNFEPHNELWSSEWLHSERDLLTFGGFLVATYGGTTEVWSSLTGGNQFTEFHWDFSGKPAFLAPVP
ncbi:MAG: hypothetical protein Q8N51_10905, partial [Gammaproteobacteria bacterium]|nr:hypothetical protein [Gammaproteobacteria bacterium]